MALVYSICVLFPAVFLAEAVEKYNTDGFRFDHMVMVAAGMLYWALVS